MVTGQGKIRRMSFAVRETERVYRLRSQLFDVAGYPPRMTEITLPLTAPNRTSTTVSAAKPPRSSMTDGFIAAFAAGTLASQALRLPV